MNDEDKLNPGHSSTRAVLRVVGPVLAGVGLLFTVAGVASFFTAFEHLSRPDISGVPSLACSSSPLE